VCGYAAWGWVYEYGYGGWVLGAGAVGSSEADVVEEVVA
jgi:hypothetical protein